jgi:hypothetical protein
MKGDKPNKDSTWSYEGKYQKLHKGKIVEVTKGTIVKCDKSRVAQA